MYPRPYLRLGFALMCAAVLVYLGSVQYLSSTALAFDPTSSLDPDHTQSGLEKVRSAALWVIYANAVAAIAFIGGLILTAQGLIQFHHLLAARRSAE